MSERRTWRTAALLALLALAGRSNAEERAANPAGGGRGEETVRRLGLILPAAGPGRTATSRGALLAIEEARRAAELLGTGIDLNVRDATGPQSAQREASALIDRGVLALIGGFDAATREALAELSEARGVPLLTLRAPGDASPEGPLREHVFHVASGPRDRRAATARWKGEKGAPASQVEIADWHPSLSRFGAEQLNQRYRARFGSPMEPMAWDAWMAVKAASEAVLRGADSPAALSRRLATLGFDGHKGARLRFRPDDHHLRQPLYVIGGGRVLAEISPEEEEE
jgi:ABC-type branched-subunit amino acid transport system substrate-binding protein